MAEGLVSWHVSANGTLVRANARYKSFLPIDVALDPAEYERRFAAGRPPGSRRAAGEGIPAEILLHQGAQAIEALSEMRPRSVP